MFVSTYTDQGQYVFEGVSSLTTHRMGTDMLSHIGYYDNKNGWPITDLADIPNRFLRKMDEDGATPTGTDIYVMGRSEDDGDVSNMIQYVLTHYWLSIYKGKLVVEIVNSSKKKTTLDMSNLDEYMTDRFSSNVDNSRKSLNPRPYYNCVAHVGSEPGATCIKKTLPYLGDVELYLSKNIDARTDRIAFFRLPCMMVMRRSTGKLHLKINTYGVYGVFVCTNTNGDKLLKNLENPAHDEWDETHWRNPITERLEPKGGLVMDELRGFLSDEITEFCQVKGRASLKMLGAGKYLYTIQDMVEQDDNDVQSPKEGILPGDQFTDSETGVSGVDVDENPNISLPTPPFGLRHGTVTNETGVASIVPPDGDDEEPPTMTVVVTPPTRKKNRKTTRNKGGHTPRPAVASDNPASVIIPIDYKVYANKEGGHTIHNVNIHSPQDVESARITFLSKREDGKNDNELDIVDSFGNGSIAGMELYDVPLKMGDNMLKIRFNDNAKHVLDINVKNK